MEQTREKLGEGPADSVEQDECLDTHQRRQRDRNEDEYLTDFPQRKIPPLEQHGKEYARYSGCNHAQERDDDAAQHRFALGATFEVEELRVFPNASAVANDALLESSYQRSGNVAPQDEGQENKNRPGAPMPFFHSCSVL